MSRTSIFLFLASCTFREVLPCLALPAPPGRALLIFRSDTHHGVCFISLVYSGVLHHFQSSFFFLYHGELGNIAHFDCGSRLFVFGEVGEMSVLCCHLRGLLISSRLLLRTKSGGENNEPLLDDISMACET